MNEKEAGVGPFFKTGDKCVLCSLIESFLGKNLSFLRVREVFVCLFILKRKYCNVAAAFVGTICFNEKIALRATSFSLFLSVQYSKQRFNINFANCWIWTADHWCQNWLLSQLSHNHCPSNTIHRHSSVDSSAPTILGHRVRFPCKPFMLIHLWSIVFLWPKYIFIDQESM